MHTHSQGRRLLAPELHFGLSCIAGEFDFLNLEGHVSQHQVLTLLKVSLNCRLDGCLGPLFSGLAAPGQHNSQGRYACYKPTHAILRAQSSRYRNGPVMSKRKTRAVTYPVPYHAGSGVASEAGAQFDSLPRLV
jgi:hypothetical protein